MRHRIAEPVSGGGRVEAGGSPALAAEGSLEQFITGHDWGSAAQPAGGCLEYQVEHER